MLPAVEEIPAGPVLLRRCRPSDAEAQFRAVSESLEHLAPWMSWAAHGYTLDDSHSWVARCDADWGSDFTYLIVAPDGGLVGCASLMGRIGPGGLEIGYWVHRAHIQRGYASAAAGALAAEAFRMGADRVEIVHDLANIASGAVPRRLGFTEVDRRPPQEDRTSGEAGLDVVWRLTSTDRLRR